MKAGGQAGNILALLAKAEKDLLMLLISINIFLKNMSHAFNLNQKA